MWYTLKAAAASLPLVRAPCCTSCVHPCLCLTGSLTPCVGAPVQVTRLVFFINVTMYLLEKWWPTAYDIACLSPYRTILYFQRRFSLC